MRLFLIILLVGISYCIIIDKTIILNVNYDIISASYDGSDKFYLLDLSGFIFSVDTAGKQTAEINPNRSGLVSPSDLAFSAGYLLIADGGARSIFIADRYLRTSIKIPLETQSKERIAPSQIAVSNENSALIWDSDRNELFFLTDIAKPSRGIFRVPFDFYENNIIDIVFDRISKKFIVILDNEAIFFSPLGVFESVLEFDEIRNPKSAFYIDSRFVVFGEDSVKIYENDAWENREGIHCNIVIQSFSGEPIFFDKSSIIFGKIGE